MMNVPIWVAILPVAVTAAIGLFTYFHSQKVLAETRRHNRATIEEARLQKKEAFIEDALTKFYYPTLGYLQVSKSLYKLLTADKPKEFRLVTYLLDPEQEYDFEGVKRKIVLSGSDRKLITEIIGTQSKLEEIFTLNGGLVTDDSLLKKYEPNPDITDVNLDLGEVGLIALALAHFRVLRLAFDGQLSGRADLYGQFVFPRELPFKIAKNIEGLQTESNELVNKYLVAGESL